MRNVFLPHEVEVILGIPISLSLPDNSRIWAWMSNGKFIVRNAYSMTISVLKEKKGTMNGGDCSDASKMTNLWKSIWNLEYPNKIKHFMWRACKDILSTNHYLARRKVTFEDRCAACGEKESSAHTLWDCRLAFEVWKESGIKLLRWNNTQRDFLEVYWKLREEALNID